MADSPDISKVISVIMENPEIISQISSLVKKNENESLTDAQSPSSDAEEVSKIDTPPVITEKNEDKRQNRTRLLYAMKPYLNESRTKAIDTMISISDILDAVRGG